MRKKSEPRGRERERKTEAGWRKIIRERLRVERERERVCKVY